MKFFLAFILLVLGGLCYALWHVWCLVPFCKWAKWLIVIILAALFFSLFLIFGKRLENMPLSIATPLYETATSGIFVLLYSVMAFIVLDLLRLFRVIPRGWLHDNGWMSLAVFVLLAGVFIYGNINYHHKYRRQIDITTAKPLEKDLKIVLLSDLHLGYHNRRAELARWVDIINAEHADMILVAGDIIDISVHPLTVENSAEEFQRLNAPIYACLGNHEYYSQEEAARRFYEDAGIQLLRDDTVTVKGICIAGRDDRTNPHRKDLKDIIGDKAPADRFTVVLDHQPFHLEEAEGCGIDFQFSGHTHYGQVWPISWITDRIYEIAYGEGQRGGTRYYVSSGMGIWGGKYRIGTRSEYVTATIHN